MDLLFGVLAVVVLGLMRLRRKVTNRRQRDELRKHRSRLEHELAELELLRERFRSAGRSEAELPPSDKFGQ
jgi:hypothetical protein